jgi:hypothetical protein
MPEPTTEPTTPSYDRAAIFHQNGPFEPNFMAEAVRTMLRTIPLDYKEPKHTSDRRMHSALLALSALHPRDEIEVMLGVQAMSAFHAASACWHLGMNRGYPCATNIRHITAACAATRTFDTMLRAIERRQAKPLTIPLGRPASRTWEDAPNPSTVIDALEISIRADPPEYVWTPEELAVAPILREMERVENERARIEKENEGLDIANTEGILPGGGMILMEYPTPQQEAYMGRRLGLQYKREYAENLRKGITTMPKIRGIRPGDLIP